MRINPAQADAVRKAFGFDGPTPFSITCRQGKLDRVAMYLDMTAADGGVAGEVKGGKMPVLGELPIRLAGANPRWPVGLWHPGKSIVPFDFLNGVALGRPDVTKDGEFYFGNLLTAGSPDLHLALASDWTAEGVRIEVSNPTGKDVTTVLKSPAAIADRKRVEEKVTVPAGATIYVTVGRLVAPAKPKQ